MKSLVHSIGVLFQPLLKLVGLLLAFFYSVIPNYAIAIALLTVLIMVVITPLTIKGTKSMAAMQALAPELKKLQQKYKGPENRQQLNEEMMRLYRENNVSPVSGCLPNLLPLPAIYVLYAVIRGLTNKMKGVPDPRYVPKCTPVGKGWASNCGQLTKLYQNLYSHDGKMLSFGMDFSQKLLLHRNNPLLYVPFVALVGAAIGLQYLQMRQLSRRNPQMAQANPQAQAMQKYMPLIMGFIYINLAAGANVYFVVSAGMRLLTQEFLFRTGRIPGPVTNTDRPKVNGPAKPTKALPAKASPKQKSRPGQPPVKKAGTTPPAKRGPVSNGKATGSGIGNAQDGSEDTTSEEIDSEETEDVSDERVADPAKDTHPRSKAKRPRKAR